MIGNVQGVVGELKHGRWDQRGRSMCGGELKRMVCSRWDQRGRSVCGGEVNRMVCSR